jgi:hypothetical protein
MIKDAATVVPLNSKQTNRQVGSWPCNNTVAVALNVGVDRIHEV